MQVLSQLETASDMNAKSDVEVEAQEDTEKNAGAESV